VASELYMLGYASERQLASALAAQSGWPAVVLDESVLDLRLTAYVTPEWSRIFSALVVGETADSIIVAAARPEDAIVPVRQLAAQRNKSVELRIALDITLARTIRLAFRHAKAGEKRLRGAECERTAPTGLVIIEPPDSLRPPADEGPETEMRKAQRALAEEAARNIERRDELPSEDVGATGAFSSEWHANTITTTNEEPADLERTLTIAEELDHHAPTAQPEDVMSMRALVVDPDPPGRIQLVAELERLGYECQAAASGPQAVDLLSGPPFEIVFADIATPELDGLRLCRAVKKSGRLARTKVVVTTSVVDSGQIADDVLAKHNTDGYLEKPLDVRRLHRLLRDLTSSGERGDHEALLADALARYHGGDIEGAIARLRGALVGDPANPKLHFMLANMLQRASRWAEAVDEYEAVVELQPAYFPALTRLAYLYFRQGMHARAVDTWRRALPVCDDPELKRNIETFMRKLVADMRADPL